MSECVAIFGASNFGKIVFEFLNEHLPDFKVQFFLDNDRNKNEYLNLKVYRPGEVNLSSIKVLVASDYYREIRKQLINLGLEENIHFFSASILYCAKLDIDMCQLVLEKFKEKEIAYKIIRREDIKKLKSSHKLFVFGSGRSLNDLTETEINYIEQHDSWVVNFSNIFKIVPTFSSYEFGGQYFLEFKQATNNVKIRENYPLTYIKDLHYYLEFYTDFIKEQFDQLPVTKDIRLHTKDLESLNSSLYLLEFLQLDKVFSEMDYYVGGATSITTIIFHALALGYMEIILCGVDLNKDIYFFEESMKNIFDPQLAQYPKREIVAEAVHPTVSEIDTIPADKFIHMINDIILKPRGVSLKVASTKSALYPKIDVYEFT